MNKTPKPVSDYFAKLAAKPHKRGFHDKEVARAAALKRWDKTKNNEETKDVKPTN